MKHIAIGGKVGNTINMDMGNKPKPANTVGEEKRANNKEVLNNAQAQQSVEIVAEETATPVVKKTIKTDKPENHNRRHKKHHRHKESTPSVDLDTEPLVDVVPSQNPSVTNNNTQTKAVTPNKKDKVPCQVKYAGILCTEPKALTNLSLYNFIDDWYGTDYRMGGNDKDGIDCSAFVQRLYLEVFGFSMVRTALEQFNNCTMVWDTDKLKEGDLVFFRIHSKRVTHVGVYLMNNFFVHASASQGVVISSLNDAYWSKYFAGAGQILEDFAPLH
jgi:lipoprotein Spr